MPIELQIIRASEFVRLDADEQLDFEASKKVLQELAYACRKRGLDHAMVDLRNVPIPEKPHFTKNELAGLVLTFRAAGFSREQRLALLYREDIHGGIRDFAFISRMRGLQVQAFTDFETALQWLSESEENAPEQSQGEIPVPIAKRESKPRKLPINPTTEGAAGMSTRKRTRRSPK